MGTTTINLVKEQAEADTPLLFFKCVLATHGTQTPPPPEYWCTHAISFAGNNYSARVLKHNLFNLQLSADNAMDGITQLSMTLADADARLAGLNAEYGFKGSQLTVYFAFADLPTGTITTESTVLFSGIAGDPEEIAEDSLTLIFTNKLSLQRVPLPDVRIQRSCPWNFPATQAQRTEAANSAPGNRFSQFYRCGYSPGVPGGVGNLGPNGQPYTSCAKSRSDCTARGMFNIDGANRATARFGGFEFVPSAVMVRTSGDKTSHLSPLLNNPAKYNDPVPIVYGQGWLKAPVIFSRNDGNLTHMEVLLGMGAIGSSSFDGVLKLVVNDVEIPKAVPGQDMNTTGSYKVFTTGARNGQFNPDFISNNQPLGDPYGSRAAVSVIVPNRISRGTSLPNVEVLLQGIAIDTYDANGTLQTIWSDNPAWVILDILRRSGWSTKDLNLQSFVSAASYCTTLIAATDINGNAASPVARYKCNLILTKRQSAAVVVRGIRVASSLMLRYGSNGLLELLPETSIDKQQPAPADGGNSLQTIDNGWPVYEFGDGYLPPFSGIVRNPNGSSTLRFTSRSIAETSNRLSVEFQDEQNEYQHDSLSVVKADDAALIGYEINSQSTALGIANFNQATRVLLQQLDKAIDGNMFVEFQTSFRSLKIRPGDIIALSSSRPILTASNGTTLSRIPFRVVKLSPAVNYQLVTILAQIHDDNWYSDSTAVLGGAGRQPSSQIQTPRPLIGLVLPNTSNFKFFDFQISERIQPQKDGTAADILTVAFSQPTKPSANAPSLPLLSLSPGYDATKGTLAPGQNFYYAISALNAEGNEGPLSFTVLAAIQGASATNSVIIQGLSFPAGTQAFNVYRGTTPQLLYQIEKQKSIIGTNGKAVTTYTDSGAPPKPVGPPDASFDHANFYWRYEYSSAYLAGTYTTNTIGSGAQNAWATPGVYVGKVVRIIDGTGRGQERSIISNDNAALTVNPAWSVLPDATSMFVVTEGSWRFAAVSASSPVQFEMPYQVGDAIQISGRGANVHNQEGTADLCPLTRVTLGQQSINGGIPPMPSFQIATPGGGDVKLYNVGFTSTTGSPPPNTQSISSGTLQLFYWNELNPPSPYALAAPLDAVTTVFSPGIVQDPPPSYTIQIDAEIMTITSVSKTANTYTVQRGVHGSAPSQAHAAGAAVLHLETCFVVVPFSPNFFGNSASINYIHTVSLPDIRISAAEFLVTNSFGDSPTKALCYATAGNGGGVRTLSGGQFSLQVSGYIATQQNAAPPLIIGDASHAVRDLRATVTQAPMGFNISVDILQNGAKYCNLTIGSGNTLSWPSAVSGVYSPQTTPAITSGLGLPALLKDGTLTMNITLQQVSTSASSVSPGRDLTVTIRL